MWGQCAIEINCDFAKMTYHIYIVVIFSIFLTYGEKNVCIHLKAKILKSVRFRMMVEYKVGKGLTSDNTYLYNINIKYTY